MFEPAIGIPANSALEAALEAYKAGLAEWMLEHAFDTWWLQGADRIGGGFYERLALTGEPMRDDNRRARVQPRQAYCYAIAGSMGWSGPWQDAIEHGLSWFEKTYSRPDGLYGTLADAKGNLIDSEFDLYNHAFALFGFASAAVALPERFDEYHDRALSMLGNLKARYAHPVAGFEEALPPREPLCSNPHMHMFEAALTWEAAAPSEPRWTALADEIATLALLHLIDADTGAMREFYGSGWTPMSGLQGQIVEPGHQFEWAWLLAIWSERRGNEAALKAAQRLFQIGETHGICPNRGTAMMSLHDDFTTHSDMARLWSQTEWLKAAIRLAGTAASDFDRQRYLESAVRACKALQMFIAPAPDGLWYDKWPAGSALVEEPAPASTFYHIVTAHVELQRFSAAVQPVLR